MNDTTNEIQTSETYEAGKVNRQVARELVVAGAAGGIAVVNADQAMELAKMMAAARVAVPPHLRNQSGACLAVVFQAARWQMDPFAVANKSYEVNGRMAYESQLVQAVILRNAPIKGRLNHSFEGEGVNRKCKVWAVLAEDDAKVEYLSPAIGQIKVKNSPLWAAEPDQQLYYYAARAFCRRFFPDVILGVYTREEVAESEPIDEPHSKLERIVNAETIDQKLNALAGVTDIEPDEPKPTETAKAPPVAAEATQEPLSSQGTGSPPAASAAPTVETVVEQADQEAKAEPPLDEKQVNTLRRLHKALEGAMTSRGVEKGIAAWRTDNAPPVGSRSDQIVALLHRAHLDRVLAKSSPAEVDTLFKKALEF